MGQVAAVFKLNPKGFNLGRGIGLMVVMLAPLVVLGVIHQEKYYISVAFGALFVGLSDPGGEYAYRVPRMAVIAAAGALLTLLGYAIGSQAWGWVTLAAFVVTLLGGLAVKYGLHRFSGVMLLNVWFIVAISLPGAYQLDHVHTNAWAQAAAWLVGSALTLAYTCILWLARGRTAQPQPVADVLPGDTRAIPLTRQVVMYAVIRAAAVAIAVAIAFGLGVQNADWMPVAALVAMKSNLDQSALIAEQRLAGAIIGAVVAALFLLTVDNKIALAVVFVILIALAGSLRAVNYAWYCAAVAGAVLIAMDVPHPSSLADEARRVGFTFAGVGIAVLVTFLASLLAKRAPAAARPEPAAQAGGSG